MSGELLKCINTTTKIQMMRLIIGATLSVSPLQSPQLFLHSLFIKFASVLLSGAHPPSSLTREGQLLKSVSLQS